MYTPIAPLALESLTVSRRTFLKSSSVLGLALAGCSSFLPRARFAGLMVNDPHPDDYHPILLGLIETILPFDHPQFPVLTPDVIASRLLALFPIDRESRFLTLQKSLTFFNELDLFPHAFAPIAAEEPNEETVEKQALDEQLYLTFLASSPSAPACFTGLAIEQKRSYLRMWGQSGFLVKRQFYRSTKALVMISAYSMDELWKTIGYGGPLLPKR
jgi:hypothetical protein